MVVAERQRQHQAWRELPSVPDRLQAGPRDAEDRHLRRIDDRREAGPADAAERTDREAAATHVGRAEFLLARLPGNLGQFDRQIEHALAIAIADHRHHQAIRGIDRDADVEILLQHQVLAAVVEGGVEVGIRLERGHHRLDQEHQRGDLDVLVFCPELLAEGFHLGDVGQILLGDMRDHRPVAGEVGPGQLLDPRQRLALDLTEPGEIDLRPWNEIQPARPGRRSDRRGQRALDECLHILLEDAVLAPGADHPRQIDAQFTREQPHRRAGIGHLVRQQFGGGELDRRAAAFIAADIDRRLDTGRDARLG